MTGFFANKIEKTLYFAALLLAVLLPTPHVKSFFIAAGWRWLYILSFSFLLSFSLTPVFRWLAVRFDLLDSPSDRKFHPDATPLLGGGAVFAGFVASIMANGIYSGPLEGILVAALVLFFVSFIDDIREIPAWLKLLVQLGCAIWVIHSGVLLRVMPDRFAPAAAFVNYLLTIFWLIGITNAMNFFDGMNGLASGLGTMISLFLGIVAFQTDQPFIGWVAGGMAGSCFGFFLYNFRAKGEATIFLGDAGSNVIGFVLACIAVYGDWAEGNPIGALASPILIFWILIFDMIHITADRIFSGKVKSFKQWIDYVGKDHLHHRLERVLGGPRRSVLFIFLISACLGASAVVLRDARPIDALLLLAQASIIVSLITILERRGRQIMESERKDKCGNGGA